MSRNVERTGGNGELGPAMDRLERILATNHGLGRHWFIGAVVGTSGWAATGPATVEVQVNGQIRQVIYRDGRVPLVGELLQVTPMSSRLDAQWLALPLPSVSVVAEYDLVAVMFDTRISGNGGLTNANPYYYSIVGRKLDGTWAVIAPHPLTNQQTFDYTDPYVRGLFNNVNTYWRGRGLCYMKYYAGRLFTWYSVGADFSPVDGGNTATYTGMGTLPTMPAFYSDDLGKTWSTLSITGLRSMDRLADGSLVAVALQGQGIYKSTNNGSTWTRLTALNRTPGTQWLWHTVAGDPISTSVVSMSDFEGYYLVNLDTGVVVGPMGPPRYSAFASGSWRDTRFPPDFFFRSNWPTRLPSGTGMVTRPDYNGRTVGGVTVQRGRLIRQLDSGFVSDGTYVSPTVLDTPNLYGYQQSLTYRHGAVLYRTEIEIYWNGPNRGLGDSSSYWVWRSTDDGATWQGILHAADPVWVDPYGGNTIASGAGRIEPDADGNLMVSVDCAYSGASWYNDYYTDTDMAPSPRFVLSTDGGATWAVADGTLIADTALGANGEDIDALGSDGSGGPWFAPYYDAWALIPQPEVEP